MNTPFILKPKLVKRISADFTPTAQAYDQLPFVVPPQDGERRCFWAPRPSGQYNFDCELGELYAAAALPLLVDPSTGPQLLRMIAIDLMNHGDEARDKGLVVGMFGSIGRALARRA